MLARDLLSVADRPQNGTVSIKEIHLNYLALLRLNRALHCKHCAHLFLEHDDYGCRHSACSCRSSQRKMIFNNPHPAPSRADDELMTLERAWFFTREYPGIPPNSLFSAMAKPLQDYPFFKVWKVDNSERFIELSTHSIRLDPGVHYHQVEAGVKVLEGKDPSSSVVNIRIMPTLIGVISLYRVFTNVDVNDKFAKHVADLIFGEIAASIRRF